MSNHRCLLHAKEYEQFMKVAPKRIYVKVSFRAFGAGMATLVVAYAAVFSVEFVNEILDCQMG